MQVQNALQKEPTLSNDNITVSVTDNTIELNGTVATAKKEDGHPYCPVLCRQPYGKRALDGQRQQSRHDQSSGQHEQSEQSPGHHQPSPVSLWRKAATEIKN